MEGITDEQLARIRNKICFYDDSEITIRMDVLTKVLLDVLCERKLEASHRVYGTSAAVWRKLKDFDQGNGD